MLRIFGLLLVIVLSQLSVYSPAEADEVSDPVKIYTAQTILHEWNWPVGIPDGKIGPNTRHGIRAFQRAKGWVETGELTVSLYNFLESIGLPGNMIWSAVSLSTDGAGQVVSGSPTRLEALDQALKGCQKRSQSPEKCITNSWFYDGVNETKWIVGVLCSTSRQQGAAVRVGRTLHEADESARTALRNSYGYQSRHCNVRAYVATDGSHQ